MEEITEKFTRDEVAMCSPCRLAYLVRRTEIAKDGDKIKFQGRFLVTHCTQHVGGNCSKCCFVYLDDLCVFVSCVPDERRDNGFAYYTIEPEGKGGGYE